MTEKNDPPKAEDFAGFMDAAARIMNLEIDPPWRSSVLANLEVTLRFAQLVTDFKLPEAAEPAPLYRVFEAEPSP